MGSVGGEHQPARLLSIPKEGERILAPTRRPDGTLRKPVRIRAGYFPQDEVAIYQSKGTLLKKGAQPDFPPGYDPALDAKPNKTKSAKRNERKKEKKNQAALASAGEKGKEIDPGESDEMRAEAIPSAELMVQRLEPVESVISQIKNLSVSTTPPVVQSASIDLVESSGPGALGADLDKRIRALKKKIRLAEAQVKSEQQDVKSEPMEKMAKVEGWREELKLLEDRKGKLVS